MSNSENNIKDKILEFSTQMSALETKLLGQAFRSPILLALQAKKQAFSESLQEKITENLPLKSNVFLLSKIRKEPESLSSEIEPIPLSEAILSDTNAITEIYDEETSEEIQAEIAEKEGFIESFSLSVILNEKQLAAKDMAFTGQSFVLTGAAGTGKTTAQRAVAKELLLSDRLSTCQFKTYDPSTDTRKYVSAPSIAFCAFTRRAAANLQKAIFKDPILAEALKGNVMTIHSLLEYEPETYIDYTDPDGPKEKFRFFPKRTAANPLTITHLIIEESSMLDAMTLWRNLYDALPVGVQIIFIGDINQLPPVFGPSILNYALVQLPVIELTEVYRNQGIVLENAHNILAGKSLKEDKDFVIIRGKANIQQGQHKTAIALGNLFNTWLDQTGSDGKPEYDPDDCIILSPWNKQDLGTDHLNAWISQHLGVRRDAIIHEIIAGFNKLYLAVGDRVMVNKLDGYIEKIDINLSYHGKVPQMPGKHLSRFGTVIMGKGSGIDIDELLPNGTKTDELNYESFSLEKLEAEKAERKNQASHKVTVKFDNGSTETLAAAGDFGPQTFTMGYALTVHKAQGSEWRKVFIILHKEHAISLYRELFYTAVTRARIKVTIIAKDFVIEKAITNQRIKGKTIEDKIAYFNNGTNLENLEDPIYATK